MHTRTRMNTCTRARARATHTLACVAKARRATPRSRTAAARALLADTAVRAQVSPTARDRVLCACVVVSVANVSTAQRTAGRRHDALPHAGVVAQARSEREQRVRQRDSVRALRKRRAGEQCERWRQQRVSATCSDCKYTGTSPSSHIYPSPPHPLLSPFTPDTALSSASTTLSCTPTRGSTAPNTASQCTGVTRPRPRSSTANCCVVVSCGDARAHSQCLPVDIAVALLATSNTTIKIAHAPHASQRACCGRTNSDTINAQRRAITLADGAADRDCAAASAAYTVRRQHHNMRRHVSTHAHQDNTPTHTHPTSQQQRTVAPPLQPPSATRDWAAPATLHV
jgi:hypothetical protein